MDSITSRHRNLLESYLRKLLEVNESLNLTRVTDYESAKLLHLEDSIAILDEINNAPAGRYLDLGSGGGLPGVPLAIITERDTTLIDSVKKKMAAVETILDDLDIETVSTVGERIEDYSKEHPEEFSVITARAVASIPSLLELASPLMAIGGHLILMKSREIDEYDEAAALEKLGLKQISYRNYYLSDEETFRSVYVFEKVHPATIDLPRRVGMAQKRPVAAVKAGK